MDKQCFCEMTINYYQQAYKPSYKKLNWAFCHSIVRMRYIESTLIQKSTDSHNFSNAKFRANAYTNHQEANSKADWWTYNTAINHTNRFSDIVCKLFCPIFWDVVYNCQEFLTYLFFLLWHKLIGVAYCFQALKSYYSNPKEVQLKILSFILTIFVGKNCRKTFFSTLCKTNSSSHCKPHITTIPNSNAKTYSTTIICAHRYLVACDFFFLQLFFQDTKSPTNEFSSFCQVINFY